MKVCTGDIVVDATYPTTIKAIVLWDKSPNDQPLLTGVGKYAPYWSSYDGITEVIGHVNIADTITGLCKGGPQ